MNEEKPKFFERLARQFRPSKEKQYDALLKQASDQAYIACIDFGTAYSKAVVARSAPNQQLSMQDVVPLRLGIADGLAAAYFCPSALYITGSNIFFGYAAHVAHANQVDPRREKFESPKHMLSSLDDKMLASIPSRSQDPTQSFTRRQLLDLLIGFLVFHFERAYKSQVPEIKGLPLLRLSRPAWMTKEEVDKGDRLLCETMARGFILASVIGTKYEADGGLAVEEAKQALRVAEQEPKLHDRFKSKLLRNIEGDSAIDRGFVPEATAVASSSIHVERRQERIFAVVDVGAGTTDMGAYYTIPGRMGTGELYELRNSIRFVSAAGNRLDSLLVTYLKERHALNESSPADLVKIARLNREVRILKEELFRDGELLGEFAGSLDEFLARGEVKRFIEEIERAFREVLQLAAEISDRLRSHPPIRVLFSGGGASLPFVRQLASIQAIAYAGSIIQDLEPAWKAEGNWKNEAWSIDFPQLAVAMGGAMKDLPASHNVDVFPEHFADYPPQ